MANTRRQAPGVGDALVAACRSLLRDIFDPYRPELHYMRGPGPQWRAKHGIPEPHDRTSVASPVPATAC